MIMVDFCWFSFCSVLFYRYCHALSFCLTFGIPFYLLLLTSLRKIWSHSLQISTLLYSSNIFISHFKKLYLLIPSFISVQALNSDAVLRKSFVRDFTTSNFAVKNLCFSCIHVMGLSVHADKLFISWWLIFIINLSKI